MCGISGILNLQNPSYINPETLKSMAYSLRHRGPDEFGAYIDDNVGLAQTRLRIIDLQKGSQPIHNEDSTLWIIFNGEIFNYPELRVELIKKGHKFITNTDTEVILHLYEEKKDDFLKDLNGQFAIAIWDSRNKELLLARDRVGIIPLYYKLEKNKLIFSSEIKSIIEASEQNTELDPRGLEQIFTFWTNLPGSTPFVNILELPPGHYYKLSSKKQILKRYWDVPLNKRVANEEIDLKTSSEEIVALLTDAIRIRLRADVPVGSYLSGGIDSSILTAIVKRNFKNELRTFGIGFEEDSFDESRYQNLMVSYYNTNHSEFIATNADIGKYFAEVIYHTEKPIFRSAPVPLFLLSKKVKEFNYKVVLTGEGADEVFGGYNIFRETKARKFWSIDPASLKRPKLLRKLYPYIFKDKRLFGNIEAFFKQGIDDPDNIFFSHLVRWNNTSKLKNFFSADLKSQISNYNAFENLQNILPEEFNKQDAIAKAQYLEMLTFMSGYLLSSQGDRMAMANSVEIRVPFLDHRVIELMANIPSKYKIRGLNEKYILKKSFKDILPKEIVYRNKNPYRAPILKSLINNSFLDVDNYFSKAKIEEANNFDFNKVNLLKKKAQNSITMNELDNMALASILSTQILYNDFVNHKRQSIPENFRFDLFYDRRIQQLI